MAISLDGPATRLRTAEGFLVERRQEWEPFELQGEQRRGAFLSRIDPISGGQSRICEERASRNIGIKVDLDIQPAANCPFCTPYDDVVPKEKIEHACGALTIRNKGPWERFCFVTLYPPLGQHKPLLSDLYFNHLQCMIESEYDLARLFQEHRDVVAFTDFTNWGPYAGASQQHPHSQRTTVTRFLDPVQQRESSRCRRFHARHRVNPFDLLIQVEEREGRRVIFSDDCVYIGAQFAPAFPNEVVVIPKGNVAHILQTDEFYRKRIITPSLGVFHALFFYMGMTNLNIAVHMAPFGVMEEARSYYRWHMHIYPRRSSLPADRAGAELGYELSVIDVLPETTAEGLRTWFREGPRWDLLARLPNADPEPRLQEEFSHFLAH